MEKESVKTIIFDLGGVLVFYDHMIAAKEMSKIIDVPAKKIFKTLSASGDKCWFVREFELGRPSKKYWSIAEKEWNLKDSVKVPYKKFDSIWCKIFFKQNKKLFEILKKLRNRGGRCLAKFFLLSLSSNNFLIIVIPSFKSSATHFSLNLLLLIRLRRFQ